MLSLRTHEYAMKRGQPVLTRVNPYVRLTKGADGIVVFIQDGRFMYEDGTEIKEADYPDWLMGEVRRISPTVREEVGLPADAKKGLPSRPSA